MVTVTSAAEALAALNGWWTTGTISAKLARPYRRKAFAEALRLLNEHRQILMLTGIRRVGKSTMLYQLIQTLLESVPPKNIIYFNFDAGSSGLLALLGEYQRITGIDWKNERVYLFLDEVQKHYGWSSQAKMLYDAFPNLKITVSGSASLQLESRAADDLTGRYFRVDMKPLSIIEYYELRTGKVVERPELYMSELRSEADRYMLRQFPEVVSWENDADIKQYIRESVIAKITRSDLPDTFKDVNFRLLEAMISSFFSRPGMIISVDTLSKEYSISKTTLENHLFYMEFSRLIRVVRNFRPSIRMESRKLRKVYPYNIALALSMHAAEPQYALETAAASRIDASNYWRMGAREVDFITREPLLPIEVKSGNRVRPEDMGSVRYFMDRFGAKDAVIIYNGNHKSNVGGIRLLPFADFLVEGISH